MKIYILLKLKVQEVNFQGSRQDIDVCRTGPPRPGAKSPTEEKTCTVEVGRSGAGAVLARSSHHTIVTRSLVEQYSNPYPLRNT